LALSTIIYEIADALYYILPAYAANAAPVIFGGGRPIDSGRVFRDGRPIFGPRKTYRGVLSGLAAGGLVGIAQGRPVLGLLLAIGAVLGDLSGSFMKRRLGMPPGSPLPIIDQLGFVAGAFLFSLPAAPPTLREAVIIAALTLPIHVICNWFAYLLKLKKEPW